MVKITFKNINYIKNDFKILSNLNFTIMDRNYTTIVGPTGAGKSTLISLINGLIKPTSGKIFFDEKDVTNLDPDERNCGVMFESYALFPHLTVLDNVSYAKHMKESKHNITYSLSEELLNLVRLTNRGDALPKECSGGMQQRVALARALMAMEKSGLLVLDEPFKALDAGLRANLRIEVRNIAKSKELGMTTLHVTNDMVEAMIGDKIIVLNHGEIKQIGTPQEVMYEPNNLFIANFFSTELNHFSGEIIKIEEVENIGFKNKKLRKIIILSDEGYYLFARTEKNFAIGDQVTFLIRSQYFKARHKKRLDKTNSIAGTVKRVKFMGAWMRIELETPFNLKNMKNLKNLKNLIININHASDSNMSNKIDRNQDQDQAQTQEQTQAQEQDQKNNKLIKIEVPTTKVAVHNFKVGEIITIFHHSQYVIVFPRFSEEHLEKELYVE